MVASSGGFNEAAVFQRRKLYFLSRGSGGTNSFNEAAVFQRRKPAGRPDRLPAADLASMRPPSFNGGNSPAAGVASRGGKRALGQASMRPPSFNGGNLKTLLAMILSILRLQ